MFNLQALESMHDKMSSLIEDQGGHINGIFYCPHHPDDQCGCRKPQTGLLSDLERELNCSLKGQISIGDSLRDLQAARAKGCIPVLVKTGKGEKTYKKIQQTEEWKDLLVFSDLAAAVDYLVDQD